MNTMTYMLPDFEIEIAKNAVTNALKIQAEIWKEKPYECIGYLTAALEIIKSSLDKAKPTKEEFYYEVK